MNIMRDITWIYAYSLDLSDSMTNSTCQNYKLPRTNDKIISQQENRKKIKQESCWTVADKKKNNNNLACIFYVLFTQSQ